MTEPVKALFVPEGAPLDRVHLEPRQITSTGHVSLWGVRHRSVLETYRRRRQLTERQAAAGEHLYRDWSIGVVGSREPPEGRRAPSEVGWEDVRLHHLKLYQRAIQELGARLSPVVVGVACEDLTVESLAKMWEVDRKGLFAVLKVALDSLGDHYGLG